MHLFVRLCVCSLSHTKRRPVITERRLAISVHRTTPGTIAMRMLTKRHVTVRAVDVSIGIQQSTAYRLRTPQIGTLTCPCVYRSAFLYAFLRYRWRQIYRQTMTSADGQSNILWVVCTLYGVDRTIKKICWQIYSVCGYIVERWC